MCIGNNMVNTLSPWGGDSLGPRGLASAGSFHEARYGIEVG